MRTPRTPIMLLVIVIMAGRTSAAVPTLQIGFEESEGYRLGPLQGQLSTQIPPAPAESRLRTDWQFYGHYALPPGVDECPFGILPVDPVGCDVGSIDLIHPEPLAPHAMALEVVDPLELRGWPFATGGHTGDRVARINGNAGEGESRSALTLAQPVIGDARFEIWLYTGNAPDFDSGNDVLNGNVGVFALAFNDSKDSGPGLHDHPDGSRTLFYIYNEQSASGWLVWETGTFDGSPRYCGGFRGSCGAPTINPPLPAAKGVVPPRDKWWGLGIELDWDEEKSRYVTWDLYYKEDGDPEWLPLSRDQLFVDNSSDFDGYLYDFDEIYIDHRPIGARGFTWTYFDDISLRPLNGGPIPGDIDGDGDVDFTDFSILAGNFTGTLDPGTGPKTRDDGDFDGDADVDFGDFSALAGNFTGTITTASGDTPDTEGDVHLEIDLTEGGAMTLQANIANLAGYSIRSPHSKIAPDADNLATPFLFYLLNAPHEVTAGSVGATTMLADDLVLDITFEGTLDEASNVVFQYTRAGEVTPVDGVVHVIPEPASMILLVAGGSLLLPRRRRSA